jgi:methyl-accepting chemotaxis protein
VILLGATAAILTLMMNNTISHLIQDEGENTAALIRDIASESYELNQERSAANGAMAHYLVNGQVVLDAEDPTAITAVNQSTRESSRLTIPTMRFEGQAFSADHEFVDTMTDLMGGTFTIFQSIPQGLLRVSTSVFTTDGNRAVGTYIPTSSPVYQTVSGGQTFYGRAFVVDAWYITMYAPLFDVSGDFVGVVYAGVKEANLDSLREKVLAIQLQESGYVSIFNGDGELVIDPFALGTDVSEAPYFEDVMAAARGEVTFEENGETWIAYFETVPEMDWHIVAKVPQAEVNAPLTRLVTVMIGAMVGLLLVAVLVSILVGTYLVRPLRRAVDIADRVAAGDLDVHIDIERKDEIGQLVTSMRGMVASLQKKGDVLRQMANKDLSVSIERASKDDALAESMITMRDSLREVLEGVRDAVEQVAAGAGEVSQASQSLSQGATESAASLEEISSSVNEVNAQARQNAETATEANSIAKEASSHAASGNERMLELKQAMSEISGSAQEINKVVKAIDDIAFQINLLALNANVEAARAGKYGKGFAVVAEEVRNLATRSGDAVRETTAIVQQSLESIQGGSDLTNSTADQLQEIASGSVKVANLLDEIAAASKEQSLAVEQVTQGLGQVDQVTQANTASAEESASASEELASQADILRNMISQFVLSSGSRASRSGLPSGASVGQAKPEQPQRQLASSR